MSDYVVSDDLGFASQLNTFNSRLSTYSTLFGLTTAEVSASAADAAYYKYVVDNQISHENRYHDWVSYKNLARKTSGNDVLGAPPAALVVAAPPTPTVQSGIENRFRTLAQRIKSHGAYNTSIGEDLGIEAPSTTVDLDNKKAVLKIKQVAGHPFIEWKKDGIDALELYGTDDTTGNYVLLGTISGKSFEDNRPLPPTGQSKLRKYKAIYRHKDKQIGHWSDEVSVSVTGI
jgi:hypothetical protein